MAKRATSIRKQRKKVSKAPVKQADGKPASKKTPTTARKHVPNLSPPIYKLCNDALLNDIPKTNPGRSSSSPSFHRFPQLPAELRIRIWKHCLPASRILSILVGGNSTLVATIFPEQYEESEKAEPRFYDAAHRNKLGNVVSGRMYALHVAYFPQWSRNLRLVSREAEEAYCSVYRLVLPLHSAPRYKYDSSRFSENDIARIKTRLHRMSHLDKRMSALRAGCIRLCPETDIVELHSGMPTQPVSGHWYWEYRERGTSVEVGKDLLAVLHDSWAHDPKGVGIARLALGRDQTSHDSNRERNEAMLLGSAVRRVLEEYPDTAGPGIRAYFSGFCNNAAKTKLMYACAVVPIKEARQPYYHPKVNTNTANGARSWNIDDMVHAYPLIATTLKRPVPPVWFRRGIPVMPHAMWTQTVEIGAEMDDGDPRPIENEGPPGAHVMHLTTHHRRGHGPGSVNIGGGTRRPLRTVFYWRRMLRSLFLSPSNDSHDSTCIDDLDKTIMARTRYLVAIWPEDNNYARASYRNGNNMTAGNDDGGTRGDDNFFHETHTEGGIQGMFRRADKSWFAYCSRSASMVTPAEINDQINGVMRENDVGVREVAGAWVFAADAMGEIPPDGGEDGVALPEPLVASHRDTTPQTIDLKVHRPGLFVMSMQPSG